MFEYTTNTRGIEENLFTNDYYWSSSKSTIVRSILTCWTLKTWDKYYQPPYDDFSGKGIGLLTRYNLERR